MPFVTRVDIDALVRPKEVVEASPVFGGDLLLRELMRQQVNDGQRLAHAVAVRDNPQAGPTALHVDTWNVGVFCDGVLDPNSPPSARTPLYKREEVFAWADRPVLWDEVRRVAERILNLSEVGPEAVKSGDL